MDSTASIVENMSKLSLNIPQSYNEVSAVPDFPVWKPKSLISKASDGSTFAVILDVISHNSKTEGLQIVEQECTEVNDHLILGFPYRWGDEFEEKRGKELQTHSIASRVSFDHDLMGKHIKVVYNFDALFTLANLQLFENIQKSKDIYLKMIRHGDKRAAFMMGVLVEYGYVMRKLNKADRVRTQQYYYAKAGSTKHSKKMTTLKKLVTKVPSRKVFCTLVFDMYSHAVLVQKSCCSMQVFVN